MIEHTIVQHKKKNRKFTSRDVYIMDYLIQFITFVGG